MNLSEALDQIEARPKRLECQVGKLLREISEEERTKLNNVIDNTNLSPALISETLQKVGIEIAEHTIRRHRKRSKPYGCKCRGNE